MTVVFSLILSFYSLLLLAFLYGWYRVRAMKIPYAASPLPVSIIVPCRNEEENIQRLVDSLSSLQYPLEKFEVIIVNDHSTDNTFEKTKVMIQDRLNFRLLKLPEGKEGKKQALNLGIDEAGFEILVTTDADCHFPPRWLELLSPYFENQKTKMVLGPVTLIPGGSFFSRLQSMEFASLVGSTAAAVGLGHPVMSNGANLAFRKEGFKAVGGYADNLEVASGDDEFLMRKIQKRYPGSIRFLNSSQTVVNSHPQATFSDFFHQRLRWAGKWRYNSDVVAQLLAFFILTSQIAFIGLVVKSFQSVDPRFSILLIGSKLLTEAVFLFSVSSFLQQKFDIVAFLILQVLYPLYVVTIGLLSIAVPHRWKNRNYK